MIKQIRGSIHGLAVISDSLDINEFINLAFDWLFNENQSITD